MDIDPSLRRLTVTGLSSFKTRRSHKTWHRSGEVSRTLLVSSSTQSGTYTGRALPSWRTSTSSSRPTRESSRTSSSSSSSWRPTYTRSSRRTTTSRTSTTSSSSTRCAPTQHVLPRPFRRQKWVPPQMGPRRLPRTPDHPITLHHKPRSHR